MPLVCIIYVTMGMPARLRSVTVKPAFEKCSDFDGWEDLDDKECWEVFNGRYKDICPGGLNAPKSGSNVSQWANSAGVDASHACCRCGRGEVGMPRLTQIYDCPLHRERASLESLGKAKSATTALITA